MANLNKPAKEAFVDLINDSSRRANSAWQDISYSSIDLGIPEAMERSLDNDYRNTRVNVYDASDTEQLAPKPLNYDRVDLQDLTRRYRNSLTFYMPANTTSVNPVSLLTALNQAAGTAITAGDLVTTPFTVTELPSIMPVVAHAESLIYHGEGSITISAPLQHVVFPYVGEMSALGVKLQGSLLSINSLPAGMGFIQTYGLPAFAMNTEYVEYYSQSSTVRTQLRHYSRYAELAAALIPERESTVLLNPASIRNFTGEPEDFIGKVVQIDEELCLVTGLTYGSGGPTEVESFTVTRGLDDTLPVEHSIGSKLYVMRDDGPKGLIAVISAGSVNAKCLAKIGADTEEPNSVDYINRVFTNRLARPYPPRNAKVNGRWDSSIIGVGRNYTVTWEHHPRFNGSARIADTIGWFEHSMYSAADPGVEYQVTVRIADGGTVLYTSPRTTGTTHTFEMPAFDGEVILEVKALIMSLANRVSPSVRFQTVEGDGLAPELGVLTLIPSSTGLALDIEVHTPGAPVAVGYSFGGTDYPYSISWEVDEGEGFNNFATNTKVILFADYPDYAEKDIRAVVTMTNTEGTDSKNSATFTLPSED